VLGFTLIQKSLKVEHGEHLAVILENSIILFRGSPDAGIGPVKQNHDAKNRTAIIYIRIFLYGHQTGYKTNV
jgi:hypothetical protein